MDYDYSEAMKLDNQLGFVCCCFTHRRINKALLKHEPMPPAPKWHFWCNNKRS